MARKKEPFFEVTLNASRDMMERHGDEYGFGMNPPMLISAKNRKSVYHMINPHLPYGVSIRGVKKVMEGSGKRRRL